MRERCVQCVGGLNKRMGDVREMGQVGCVEGYKVREYTCGLEGLMEADERQLMEKYGCYNEN